MLNLKSFKIKLLWPD